MTTQTIKFKIQKISLKAKTMFGKKTPQAQPPLMIGRNTSSRRPNTSSAKSAVSSISSSEGGGGGVGGGSSIGSGGHGQSGAEKMRKQLDGLRKMQMDLARKHLEMGSASLRLSFNELNPDGQHSADTSNEMNEKAYSERRRESIAKREADIHGLMTNLQDMSDAMARINFEQNSVIVE
ncbi:hypothetical protein HK100_000389, partial [Physocladia obscura]